MKIAVAMSGGVDSSLSAALIKKENPDTFGVFMKNWSDSYEEKAGSCTWIEDRRDALRVAAYLDMPLKTVDCEEEYRKFVLEYFYREYEAGRTPNPDILCNRFMKFDILWQEAAKLGATKMATGHYARIRESNGKFYLLKGIDASKDQSYFLCNLTQEQLSRSLFPVGEMNKSEVRLLAQSMALPTAEKKDSQGICFIGKVELREFLKFRLALKPGDILNSEGKTIGTHQGASSYTIGQRHGLDIKNHTNTNEPWFVIGTNTTHNTVTVAQGKDNPLLFKKTLNSSHFHWITEQPQFPLHCHAKIRYRQTDQACIVDEDGLVTFSSPQRAITPGQSIVFYQHDTCLGSAIIEASQ